MSTQLRNTMVFFQRVDYIRLIAVCVFAVLVGHMIYTDLRRDWEVKHLVKQNEMIYQQLGRVSPYINYGDMEFPKVNSGITRNQAIEMIGVTQKIAVDAVKKRDSQIADLKVELKNHGVIRE